MLKTHCVYVTICWYTCAHTDDSIRRKSQPSTVSLGHVPHYKNGEGDSEATATWFLDPLNNSTNNEQTDELSEMPAFKDNWNKNDAHGYSIDSLVPLSSQDLSCDIGTVCTNISTENQHFQAVPHEEEKGFVKVNTPNTNQQDIFNRGKASLAVGVSFINEKNENINHGEAMTSTTETPPIMSVSDGINQQDYTKDVQDLNRSCAMVASLPETDETKHDVIDSVPNSNHSGDDDFYDALIVPPPPESLFMESQDDNTKRLVDGNGSTTLASASYTHPIAIQDVANVTSTCGIAQDDDDTIVEANAAHSYDHDNDEIASSGIDEVASTNKNEKGSNLVIPKLKICHLEEQHEIIDSPSVSSSCPLASSTLPCEAVPTEQSNLQSDSVSLLLREDISADIDDTSLQALFSLALSTPDDLETVAGASHSDVLSMSGSFFSTTQQPEFDQKEHGFDNITVENRAFTALEQVLNLQPHCQVSNQGIKTTNCSSFSFPPPQPTNQNSHGGSFTDYEQDKFQPPDIGNNICAGSSCVDSVDNNGIVIHEGNSILANTVGGTINVSDIDNYSTNTHHLMVTEISSHQEVGCSKPDSKDMISSIGENIKDSLSLSSSVSELDLTLAHESTQSPWFSFTLPPVDYQTPNCTSPIRTEKDVLHVFESHDTGNHTACITSVGEDTDKQSHGIDEEDLIPNMLSPRFGKINNTFQKSFRLYLSTIQSNDT